MIYKIYHKTAFSYQDMVSFSHNLARLQPINTQTQRLLEFDLQIEPTPFESSDFLDSYANHNRHILIREPHKELSLMAVSRVEISALKREECIATLKAKSITFGAARERLWEFHAEDIAAKQFLFESEYIRAASEEIKSYALESFHPKRDLYEAAFELMQRVFSEFTFVSGFSDITTPVEDIFRAKKGVCQDFAQFCIAALRSIGLCAKYVSGYIETLPPKGEEKLFGVDASHAWFALYIPGAGWAEFDPTNNIVPHHQHITLGSGRDYYDISPLKGVLRSSGASRLSVMVDVRREDPKPLQTQENSSSTEAQTQLQVQTQL